MNSIQVAPMARVANYALPNAVIVWARDKCLILLVELTRIERATS